MHFLCCRTPFFSLFPGAIIVIYLMDKVFQKNTHPGYFAMIQFHSWFEHMVTPRKIVLAAMILIGIFTPVAGNAETHIASTTLPGNSATENATRINITLQPHFDTFDAHLHDEDMVVLDGYIDELSDISITHMYVTGHTDSLPIRQRSRHLFADNYALSAARAASVGRYLADALSLSPSQMTIMGKGPDIPVADNRTAEGRDSNRRVMVTIDTEKVVDRPLVKQPDSAAMAAGGLGSGNEPGAVHDGSGTGTHETQHGRTSLMPFHAWLEQNFTAWEIKLVEMIFILMCIMTFLVALTVVFKFRHKQKQKHLLKKQKEWQRILLAYIGGNHNDISLSTFTLRHYDIFLFGAFIDKYLENLKGVDRDRVVKLLHDIRYDELLIPFLTKRSVWVRAFCAHFLGIMRSESALSKLEILLNDPSHVVSLNAFEALCRMDGSEKCHTLVKEFLTSQDLGGVLFSNIIMIHGPAVYPLFMEMLENPSLDTGITRRIIDVLASRNVVESLPKILEIAGTTKSAEVRIGCIKAMVAFKNPLCLEYVVNQIESPDWVMRSQAAKALGYIGNDTHIPLLKTLLNSDEHYWVKLYSALSLKQFGKPGKRILKSALKRPDPETERIAQYVLHDTTPTQL
jgi:outer membrane protein OmpA-like peptidoglycan-associated protein